MTDQLIMTTAQRDTLIEALDTHPDFDTEDLISEAVGVLQSLPMVIAEPVAWLVETEADAGLGILPYTVIAETEHGAGIREMLGAFQVYRTPKPLHKSALMMLRMRCSKLLKSNTHARCCYS